jgi:hypothetical protein
MFRGGTRTTTRFGGATWRRRRRRRLEDIMEGDVLASTQPSTLIDTPTPTHTSRCLLSESGPSTVWGRLDKQSIIFSRKRGRGH